MPIRIKNEHVHAMAKELAALTEKTQVAAIKLALEERLIAIQTSKASATRSGEVKPASQN